MSQVCFSIFSLFLPVYSFRSSRAASVATFHPHSLLSDFRSVPSVLRGTQLQDARIVDQTRQWKP
jgi:hypothetical protein